MSMFVLQAFVEVLASNETFSAPMEETYKKLDIDPNSVTTLDAYLSEYYSQILKKLKEVGAQGRQTGAADVSLLQLPFQRAHHAPVGSKLPCATATSMYSLRCC